MKNFTKSIVLSLCVAVAAIFSPAEASAAPAKAKGAQIVLNIAKKDMGTFDVAKIQSYSFVIENRGDQPLVINNIKTTSKSGMKVQFSTKPMKAGAKHTVKVTCDAKQMPVGSFSKVVEILSNAKNYSRMTYRVTGRSQKVAAPTKKK